MWGHRFLWASLVQGSFKHISFELFRAFLVSVRKSRRVRINPGGGGSLIDFQDEYTVSNPSCKVFRKICPNGSCFLVSSQPTIYLHKNAGIWWTIGPLNARWNHRQVSRVFQRCAVGLNLVDKETLTASTIVTWHPFPGGTWTRTVAYRSIGTISFQSARIEHQYSSQQIIPRRFEV